MFVQAGGYHVLLQNVAPGSGHPDKSTILKPPAGPTEILRYARQEDHKCNFRF